MCIGECLLLYVTLYSTKSKVFIFPIFHLVINNNRFCCSSSNHCHLYSNSNGYWLCCIHVLSVFNTRFHFTLFCMLFLLICDLVNPVLLYCFLVICLLFNKHMNSQDFSRIMTLTILSKFHFESKNSHCLVILLLQVVVHLFVHSRECLKREMEVMLKE